MKPDSTERRKDALAALIIDFYHRGSTLAPFHPGEPAGLEPAVEALRSAPVLLDRLGSVYGVDTWDEIAWARTFVGRALAAWKPGLRVEVEPGALVVEGKGCPIAAEVEIDPRVCRLCQAMQLCVAQLALGDRLAEARFELVTPRPDGTCRLRVEFAVRDVADAAAERPIPITAA